MRIWARWNFRKGQVSMIRAHVSLLGRGPFKAQSSFRPRGLGPRAAQPKRVRSSLRRSSSSPADRVVPGYARRAALSPCRPPSATARGRRLCSRAILPLPSAGQFSFAPRARQHRGVVSPTPLLNPRLYQRPRKWRRWPHPSRQAGPAYAYTGGAAYTCGAA
jgi:hypothetical protein